MNIKAGKSVCGDQSMNTKETEECIVTDDDVSPREEPTTSRCSKKDDVFEDNSSEDIDFEELAREQEKENQFVNFLEGKSSQYTNAKFQNVVKERGRFVVFSYEGKFYPGEIVAFDEETVTINAMQKSLKMWKWPSKRDELTYQWSDVLGLVMYFGIIFAITLLSTVYSQMADIGLPPDLQHKLERFSIIYLEKCGRNLNENEGKNLNVALETVSKCISNQPQPARSSLEFCNLYGTQFVGCLRSFADAGKGCLDQDEKYLPNFILNGMSRVFENYCKKNSIDHIEILNKKCQTYLGKVVNSDFLTVCVPKLKIIANLDNRDYSLNRADVCSDLKTSQECLVNDLRTKCQLAQEDLDFVNSVFETYRSECNFANINIANFILLAALFLSSRLIN
ncbi:hypothetical protein RN001_000209 [Aquatica leii]|uniref:Uncharacterized protein n=1 Tax=Aquatica leii TaxID=1421715 RepID=A0AAN7QLX3_9COLE|nr:hypothetical protein RN001_000209 [Aquatica leii]